ncbi:uncharacterized protein N0V96_001009 [Colletotrichum fioriniae]|uniref:uncharacterized protein n=1 Tax=Colletotrichum fioriniae TaxID=710243 RepID=UPI0032DB8AE1|nr:hypothetical protein N0V96_001009 [Colletotrichum fioriniae]
MARKINKPKGGEPRVCYIPARWLGRIFVVADIATFIVQATGGVMAGPTVEPNTRAKGVKIYIIGMGVQEGFIVVFLMLMARFHYRAIQMNKEDVYGLEGGSYDREDEEGYMPRRNWKALQFALYAALLAITARIIFRLVEFTGGMTPEENPIPFTEAYAYALDAFPMMLALLILAIIHPGRVLQGTNSEFPRKGCRQKRKEKKEKKAVKKAAKEERKAAKEEKKRIKNDRKKMKTYGEVPDAEPDSYGMGLIDGQNHEPMRYADYARLGKIVRVAPQEISISDYETGVRQVYNAGFEKPGYFDFFQYYGQRNSFASRSRADHAACRRRVSSSYSKTTLFASETLSKVTHNIMYQRLIPVLQHHSAHGQPVELLRLCYASGLDMLNCYILGLSSGPDFTRNPELTEMWLEHYENRYSPQGFWLQELPKLYHGLRKIGLDVMPRKHYESTEWIENWMLEHCDKSEAVYRRMQNGEQPPAEDIPVVYNQLRKAMSNLKDGKFLDMQASEELSRISIASEIFDHMSGAREVFGLVLAYAVYYLAQNPAQQEMLKHAVAGLGMHVNQVGTNDANSLPSPQTIESIAYLQAVIKESLRMRPNSTPLPRITPHDKSVSISGVDGIPAGTRVNCFQWFLHRNPEMWTQPNAWVPERWLDPNGAERTDMPPLWAFVTGPRACIGTQLTYYLFGYILAGLFSNFNVQIARPETYGRHTPGSLEDELFVLMTPIAA